LEFSGGNLIATPFLAATDPSGSSILTTPGWTFTRVGNNEISIAHPIGKWFINFNRFAQNTSGGTAWVSAAISGASLATNSVNNTTSQASFNIQALSASQTGLSGTGTAYMYITFQEPSYDFAV
jgi:hypothetical protein